MNTYATIPDVEVERAKAFLLDSTATMALMYNKRGGYLRVITQMASQIVASMLEGGKLLIAGNGGSAADAQHLAAEFVARLNFDREPMPAIALTTDSSVLTAIGNDYGFEHVFERQVLALGRPGDVLLLISTSGQSLNVRKAVIAARVRQMTCLAFTSEKGVHLSALCDFGFMVPSDSTAIIQQCHIAMGHVLCAMVERTMFPLNATVVTEPAMPAPSAA